MIKTGIETVHTSAMVFSICISPPSLPFHTKSLSSFTIPSRIPSAAHFPSLKASAKRNRFSNQTANELNGLRIEDTDEDERTEWEEEILRETAPLVAFMKMILQPGRYRCGDRLDPEHEKMILERILPYHPGFERKIGCGIDYITIGYHPDFERSRCLFVVQKDGEVADFSYWKCIKGLIRTKYSQHADSFIFKYFRWRERY